MEIHIDLFGCKDKEDVLLRLGEILQLGGPKGNVPAGAGKRIGWGVNWDALDDCFYGLLETGGVWGTSKKVKFPVTIFLYNFGDFQRREPKEFKILKEIFLSHAERYTEEGKKFEVVFIK